MYCEYLIYLCLVLLEEYIQFQKNQSMQPYFCQYIETQYVTLLFLSLRFMTYAPFLILGKLFLERMPLKL